MRVSGRIGARGWAESPLEIHVCSRRTHDHHCAFYLSVDRDTTSRYGKHYFRQENMIGESKVNRWCPVAWSTLQKYRLYFSTYICSIKIEEFIKFFSLILPTFRRFYFSNYQNSLNFLLASLFKSFHVSNYFHLYLVYISLSISNNLTEILKFQYYETSWTSKVWARLHGSSFDFPKNGKFFGWNRNHLRTCSAAG